MLEALRAEVSEANLELVRRGLVLYTFGNASGISREDGLVVIKPSGVPYEHMTPADMVITDLEGRMVEGNLRPSTDLATHTLCIALFLPLEGSRIRTRGMPRLGRRPGARSRASEPRTPIISTDRCR